MRSFSEYSIDTPANREKLGDFLRRFMLESSFIEFGVDDLGRLFAMLRREGDVRKVFVMDVAALELGMISDDDAMDWIDQLQELQD